MPAKSSTSESSERVPFGNTTARRPLMEPLRRKPGKGDTALEAADLALSTLAGIVALAPVPFVAEAANVVISLFDTIKDVKDNKEAFKHLVDDCYRLVSTTSDVCHRLKKDGKAIPEDLLIDIAGFVSTLRLIENYAHEKVKRNLGTRILFKNHDLQVIRRYREELKQALDAFHVQSGITLRTDVTILVENVAELTRGQTQLLNHFDQTTASTTRTDNQPRSHSAAIPNDSNNSLRVTPHPKHRSQSDDFRPSLPPNSRTQLPPSSASTYSPRTDSPSSDVQSSSQYDMERYRPVSWSHQQQQSPQFTQSPPNSATSLRLGGYTTGSQFADELLANHPNPAVHQALGISHRYATGSPTYAGSGQYYQPQQLGSPGGAYSGGYVNMPGGTSINSGTTTVTNVIGSNNDYSSNVFYGDYQQMQQRR